MEEELPWKGIVVHFLPHEWENLVKVVMILDPKLRPAPSPSLVERVARAERKRRDPTTPDFENRGAKIRSRNRIYELRRAKGLTMSEMCKLMGGGFSPHKISRQELGKMRLSGTDIEAYAALFKVYPHELFIDNLTILDEDAIEDDVGAQGE